MAGLPSERISRFLTYLLRHRPKSRAQITIDRCQPQPVVERQQDLGNDDVTHHITENDL